MKKMKSEMFIKIGAKNYVGENSEIGPDSEALTVERTTGLRVSIPEHPGLRAKIPGSIRKRRYRV